MGDKVIGKVIAVGSENKVKINCVREAVNEFWRDGGYEVIGVAASSGVDKQPKSSEETLRGAITRAKNAFEAQQSVKYAVGIEGGVEDVEGEGMWAFAWIVVVDNEGKIGKGQTGKFLLPEGVAKLVREGYELGEADDLYFTRQNSKQNEGAIGILSNNVISRTELYKPAVVFAFLRWINPHYYADNL